jgi:hypothetical protein
MYCQIAGASGVSDVSNIIRFDENKVEFIARVSGSNWSIAKYYYSQGSIILTTISPCMVCWSCALQVSGQSFAATIDADGDYIYYRSNDQPIASAFVCCAQPVIDSYRSHLLSQYA